MKKCNFITISDSVHVIMNYYTKIVIVDEHLKIEIFLQLLAISNVLNCCEKHDTIFACSGINPLIGKQFMMEKLYT